MLHGSKNKKNHQVVLLDELGLSSEKLSCYFVPLDRKVGHLLEQVMLETEAVLRQVWVVITHCLKKVHAK